MPLDKNKIIRFQALDRCFSDRSRHYYIEDLVGECRKALERADVLTPDVSKRSVYNDIAEMEGNPKWNVAFLEPAKDGRKRYYQYEDPSYSIWNNDLNAAELAQLQSVLLMLRRFKGLPQYQHLEEMIQNLQNKYGFTLPEEQEIISFGTNEYVQGLDYLSPLCMAIINKQALEILYQPFGQPEYTRTLHPYYIKEYNNRWFLLAKEENVDWSSLSVVALDRIHDVHPSSTSYIPNTEWDFSEYFSDIIGVTRTGEPPVKLVLEFSTAQLPYVLSKPLHEEQRIHRRAEGIIELEVCPNRELYQKLLSFGCEVEVLEPASVREHLKEEIRKMLKYYE